MAKEQNSRTIGITSNTAKKLDKVKSGLWFKSGVKPTNDGLIEYLLEKELKELEDQEKEKKD